MYYEGDIYRPPSEAASLIIQVTVGCAHNDCTFCSMFKDKQFRIKPQEQIYQDLHEARTYYGRVGRIFFADGDALCLKTDRLVEIFDLATELFPELERIGIYASPQDVLAKTEEELALLAEHGLGIIYIGAESGSDEVLARVKKGATKAQIANAIRKIEASRICASVTFISGLGGIDLSHEHAIESGKLISETRPSYVGLLTLMIDSRAPISREIESGEFRLLSAQEVVLETRLLLEHIDLESIDITPIDREPIDRESQEDEEANVMITPKKCVFRSNHASNYLSLKGNLPDDKEILLAKLDTAIKGESSLKDERLRAL